MANIKGKRAQGRLSYPKDVADMLREEHAHTAYLFGQEKEDRLDERAKAGIHLMHERGTYADGKPKRKGY